MGQHSLMKWLGEKISDEEAHSAKGKMHTGKDKKSINRITGRSGRKGFHNGESLGCTERL